MNRRNFLTGIIAACVAPAFLPSAKIEPRRWIRTSPLYTPCWMRVHPWTHHYDANYLAELSRLSAKNPQLKNLERNPNIRELDAQKRFVNEFFYGVPMHDEVAMRNLGTIECVRIEKPFMEVLAT